MHLYAIYGAGGFGREVMPVARRQLDGGQRGACELVFVVDDVGSQREVNGYPVLSYAQFLARPAAEKFFNVAISASVDRQRLAEKCLRDGLRPFSVSARESVCYEPNRIGEGAILCAYSVITANVAIGRFFHANLHAYVAHDCVIGDYVSFAPGVQCNGNVVVEDHAYLGSGAIIRNGSRAAPVVIGKGAVVGMGAVVTQSVPPGMTVVGNPARAIGPSAAV